MNDLLVPDPFADLVPVAHLSRGRRAISWTVVNPGTVHRCRFDTLWVTIEERQPWRGEPLWLSVARRVGQKGREPLTEKARSALESELVPAVARYGFDALWSELHRAGISRCDDRLLAEAQARLVWEETRRDLVDMYRSGMLDTKPVSRDPSVRWPTVTVVDGQHRRVRADVAASLVADHTQVGWLTVNGAVVPLDDILNNDRVW